MMKMILHFQVIPHSHVYSIYFVLRNYRCLFMFLQGIYVVAVFILYLNSAVHVIKNFVFVEDKDLENTTM